MKKLILAIILFATPVIAQGVNTIGPNTVSPCAAFGTTQGTCIQGSGPGVFTTATATGSITSTKNGGGSTAAFVSASTGNGYAWISTDATTDTKTWDLTSTAGGLTEFRVINDANNAVLDWFTAQRTGISAVAVGLPTLASSSAAQTGTVCWTTGGGNLTVDTTTTCLLSLEEDKNIKGYINPFQALLSEYKLKPFWFSYKLGTNMTDHANHAGLGAHQVESVDPRLVGYDPKGKLQGVRYADSVSSLTVAAVQGLELALAAVLLWLAGLTATVIWLVRRD